MCDICKKDGHDCYAEAWEDDLPRKTHNLKTDRHMFRLSWLNIKPLEIRYDDRNFRVDEELVLKETKHTGKEMKNGKPLAYTGRRIRVKVLSHITGYGLKKGWCAMGVEELHRIGE